MEEKDFQRKVGDIMYVPFKVVNIIATSIDDHEHIGVNERSILKTNLVPCVDLMITPAHISLSIERYISSGISILEEFDEDDMDIKVNITEKDKVNERKKASL